MNIIQQLQNIFPSLVLLENKKDRTDYKWFELVTGEIVGISEDELTEEHQEVLNIFLKKYEPSIPNRNDLEQLWFDRIHFGTSEQAKDPFRFIFFQIQQSKFDHQTVVDVLDALLNKDVPIIWLNNNEGILIETVSITDEETNFRQVVDILVADASVQMKFFLGTFVQSFDYLHKYYETIVQTGKNVFQYTNEQVIDYFQSFPYLLLRHINEDEKNELVQSILQKFKDDEDMLHTLQMFLQHNMNVSETAKKLFMHRNSLQYRIDKFVSETGIRIQKFDQALAVQLAMIANKMIDTK